MPINKSTRQGYLGNIGIRKGIFDMYEQEFLNAIPEFIGTSSNNIITNVTSIDFAVPSGSRSGDFAVAMLSGGGGTLNEVGDWANSQGFTFLYENPTQNLAGGSIAYKILDGTEGANFTFTTTNSCKLSGEIVVYRGSNSILFSSENIDSGNDVTQTATSITASKNSILFAFFVVSGDNILFSNLPSDLTLLRTYSGSHKHNYWIGYKTLTSSGPTGDYNITISASKPGVSFLFTI